MKLDLDYKGEKIIALSKELEELQIGGGASEEELNSVKRQKTDLEMRLKEQVSFDSIINFTLKNNGFAHHSFNTNTNGSGHSFHSIHDCLFQMIDAQKMRKNPDVTPESPTL